MAAVIVTPVSIVMTGASGAVGTQTVATLAARAELVKLTSLGRRTINLPGDPRLSQHTVDLLDPRTYTALLEGHTAAICTLGVGEPSKASKEEFTRVDHDMPLAFARACRQAGVSHFSLLSSVGASPDSRSFYLRSKGRLQEELKALGFRRLSLFQPSMILTPTNRYGVLQAVTLAVWPLLTPVLFGPMRKLRGIRVEQLGRAIAMNALGPGEGVETIEWDGFQRLQQAAGWGSLR